MAGSLRSPETTFLLPRSVDRWRRWIPQGPAIWSRMSWIPQNLRGWGWWPDPDFSVVDSVLWPFVTAIESVALVSMLGYFFLFYGCSF